MKKVFIGIDNGVSGTIGIITPDTVDFFTTPTFSEQNYTKAKGNITRIDISELGGILEDLVNKYNLNDIIASIERPMVNPRRFKASTSALRALEATLIVVESLKIPFRYIDSKEWQKNLLPKGLKGDLELKKASLDIGNRLYPQFKNHKHKDRDGLLIAEYLKRTEK